MIIPVILSGGAGTRLWPLSRELYPKQLLPLAGRHTMLQETLLRLQGLEAGPPLVVCNEEHRFLVAEQLRQLEIESPLVILEPVGRNTAPAVAVAALQALAGGDDPLLLILPADHVIRDRAAFQQAVLAGADCAERGSLVTFGVVPDKPETGYGYIRAGERLEIASQALASGTPEPSSLVPRAIADFVEKPDAATAQAYLASGEYTWNSGMFLFRASRYLEELEKFAPEMLSACRRAHAGAAADLDFLRLDREAFAASPADSIDYAVMEKTLAAVVLPLAAGWNDVGSWSALWEVGEQDADGNICRGEVLSEGSRDCYLYSSGRIVAAVGLVDHVVVETADAVLVAAKSQVQEVKKIVERLKREHRPEALLHRRVSRPWGAYEGVDAGERFQVKRITVHPGAKLSLQLHHHRAEHWVVVKGTARVTCGDQVRIISENESTYIPLGVSHRLENPGKVPLEIIEVQSGSYLGEDDIVRIEDQYGR